jgi:hypothetical protein
MRANNFLLLTMALLPAFALAQDHAKPSVPVLTIGQLADQARQARLAGDVARPGGDSSRTTPGAPPAGMLLVPATQVPSTQIITNGAAPAASAAASKPVPPVKPVPPPEFVPKMLGVHRVGARRYVELLDERGPVRFEMGQTTPSGWTVTDVSIRGAVIAKPDPITKQVRHIPLPIQFR